MTAAIANRLHIVWAVFKAAWWNWFLLAYGFFLLGWSILINLGFAHASLTDLTVNAFNVFAIILFTAVKWDSSK